MKKNILYLIAFSTILLLNSCEDLLNDLTSAEIAQKLEGSWQCDENSSIFKSTQDIYSVYIYMSDSDSTRIFISNFYALGESIGATALVNGYSITIPIQTLEGGFEVGGTGTISSDLKEISWNYTVDDGSGEIDEVEAVYTSLY